MVEENFWDVRTASNGSRSPSLMSDQLEQPEEMVKEKKNYWYSVGSEKHVFENVQSGVLARHSSHMSIFRNNAAIRPICLEC